VFPLHACKLSSNRFLADECEVIYTPSLSLLHRCAARNRSQRSQLLLAENPTYDLDFTEVEGACLRSHYPQHHHLNGSSVTRDRLLRDGQNCHVLHYSGHATFDVNDPLNSALVLEDKQQPDKWLTLRQIFCGLHLQQTLLTVISGCESGMLRPDRVDEYVGLPSSFLFAGAPCVVSSLWAVYDLSSALVMDRFHRNWLGGQSVGAALREAQRWLREDVKTGVQLRDEVLPGLLAQLPDEDLKQKCRQSAAWYAERCPERPPFASPAEWAPFIATGLAYSLTLPADTDS
jgi:CHAT domain-containing protein